MQPVQLSGPTAPGPNEIQGIPVVHQIDRVTERNQQGLLGDCIDRQIIEIVDLLHKIPSSGSFLEYHPAWKNTNCFLMEMKFHTEETFAISGQTGYKSRHFSYRNVHFCQLLPSFSIAIRKRDLYYTPYVSYYGTGKETKE